MYCPQRAEMEVFWREWAAKLCSVCGGRLIQESRKNGNPPEVVDLWEKEGECPQ